MATYNGEKYIEEQIDSIMRQISAEDEVIISDDGSKDNTVLIIERMKEKYPQIMFVEGPRKGYSCNFGNAMKYATGDIVLISDQDDIWHEKKVEYIKDTFAQNPTCTTVMHKMNTFRKGNDSITNEIEVGYRGGMLRNWIKSCYWGCCMGVKREFIESFLPFRDYCVGYDQLIGLISEKYGKTVFINEKLIFHRLHEENTSGRLPFLMKIKFRIDLLKDYRFTKNNYKIFLQSSK